MDWSRTSGGVRPSTSVTSVKPPFKVGNTWLSRSVVSGFYCLMSSWMSEYGVWKASARVAQPTQRKAVISRPQISAMVLGTATASLRDPSLIPCSMMSRVGCGRMGHLRTRYLLHQQALREGHFNVVRCVTKENPSDLGTKVLEGEAA